MSLTGSVVGCQAFFAAPKNLSFWAGSWPYSPIAQPSIFAPGLEEALSKTGFGLVFIVDWMLSSFQDVCVEIQIFLVNELDRLVAPIVLGGSSRVVLGARPSG